MLGILSYLIFFSTICLILAIATLGLNLQWGTTGIFNAGVVGFYGIGAYAMAILTAEPRASMIANMGLPWIVGILGAMAVTGLAALIIGLATIRLRGDFLAISTFGIATTFQLITLNWQSLTGGSMGFPGIPRPFYSFFETSFSFNLFYLGVVVVAVGIIYWALEAIVGSPWGRTLKAIREDETAAVALGKDATRFRLQSFVLGSMIIGLAGALYVSYIGFVSPFDFLPILTFQIWTMLIVGGSGNNRGAIMGAIIVWGLWSASGIFITKVLPLDFQTQAGALQAILIGVILIATLIFRPRGLIGEAQVVSRHVDRTTK